MFKDKEIEYSNRIYEKVCEVIRNNYMEDSVSLVLVK